MVLGDLIVRSFWGPGMPISAVYMYIPAALEGLIRLWPGLLLKIFRHMSYSLKSLKGVYIGDYYKGYEGGY